MPLVFGYDRSRTKGRRGSSTRQPRSPEDESAARQRLRDAYSGMKGQTFRPTIASRTSQRSFKPGNPRRGQSFKVEYRPTDGGYDKVHVYESGKVIGAGRGKTFKRGQIAADRRRKGSPFGAKRKYPKAPAPLSR